jgi:tetratricopeptide (TPR) repeat protein
MFRANCVAIQGRLEEGRSENQRGIELARAYDDTESLGWAHMQAVNIARLDGELSGAVAHGKQAVEIAERIGDAFSRAIAPSFLGMAYVSTGEAAAAIPHLERSLEIGRERRTALEFMPWTLSLLAEALAAVGDGGRARAVGEESLALTTERGTAGTELNARRALARVLMAAEGAAAGDEIETRLRESISISERIGARGEALQARMDLARLAALRGDESARRRALEEARALAEEIAATGHARRLAEELAEAVA